MFHGLYFIIGGIGGACLGVLIAVIIGGDENCCILGIIVGGIIGSLFGVSAAD